MSKQIKLVYGVCYTNPNFLCNTVRSLIDGLVKPSDIVIADYGVTIANSLKKKDYVSIIKTPNYGMLSSLYAILEKYGSSSPHIHIILVDEATTYMPHLASEYLNTAPNMLQQLKSKIPDGTVFSGAAFGLSGVLFNEDKQKNLDTELESLLDEDQVKTDLSFKRTQPTILKDTSTVDVLEFSGSIYFTANMLDGFKKDVFTKPSAFNRFEATVILSNFFGKKNIFRIHVCHLMNNRFIMDRIGCFSHLQTYAPTEYIPLLNDLFINNELFLCKDTFVEKK